MVRGTLKSALGKQWIKKTVAANKANKAYIELLGQEFFRLLIPHQPETRLFTNRANNQFYILSEEVKDYKPLPEGESHNFTSGKYRGLGQVVVAAMFLQETDLKNGNVGLNNINQVIKIDGDYCFSGYQQKNAEINYQITSESIARLPQPHGYYAFNWLDKIRQEKMMQGGLLLSDDLTNAAPFRAEVNQALRKISVLTDSHIDRFVRQYIPSQQADSFITLIKARRDQLKDSALKNNSFCAYLKTSQAKEDEKTLLQQIDRMIGNTDKVVSRNVAPLPAQTTATKEVLLAQIDKNLEILLGCKACGTSSIHDPEIDRYYRAFADIKNTIVNDRTAEHELRCIMLDNLAKQIHEVLLGANSDYSKSLRKMIGEKTSEPEVRNMLIATLINTPVLQRGNTDFAKKCIHARDKEIPAIKKQLAKAEIMAQNQAIKDAVQAGRPSQEHKNNEEPRNANPTHP